MEILRWAEDRRIIPNSTPQAQYMKAASEMGELADALTKNDLEAMQDAVGDVMVCLINMCALLDLDIVDCMAHAYDQIKDRKGTLMPSGVFVKESGPR
jgi:NTP pyrophosphatase (non-canonical NTP hydrolase)